MPFSPRHSGPVPVGVLQRQVYISKQGCRRGCEPKCDLSESWPRTRIPRYGFGRVRLPGGRGSCRAVSKVATGCRYFRLGRSLALPSEPARNHTLVHTLSRGTGASEDWALSRERFAFSPGLSTGAVSHCLCNR